VLTSNSRNFELNGVTLNWARLHEPQNPFGTEQYELQVAFKSPDAAEALRKQFFDVKEKDGEFFIRLNRKVYDSKGQEKRKPIVQNADGTPFDFQAQLIGNGSTGNVTVYQYNYDQKGRKGVANQLDKVVITNLIPYTPQGEVVSFEIEPSATPATQTPTESVDLF